MWLTPDTEVIKSPAPQDHMAFVKMVGGGGRLSLGHLEIQADTQNTDFLLRYRVSYFVMLGSLAER